MRLNDTPATMVADDTQNAPVTLITEWWGCTPETENLSHEEFDKEVRSTKRMLKEFHERNKK